MVWLSDGMVSTVSSMTDKLWAIRWTLFMSKTRISCSDMDRANPRLYRFFQADEDDFVYGVAVV